MIEKCEGAESEAEAISRLVKGGIDGVILPPPLCDSQESLKAVPPLEYSVVVTVPWESTAVIA